MCTIQPYVAMFGLSVWELGLILVVVLLLFGTRIPTVMRSLGKGVVEFKSGMKEGDQPESSSDKSK